VLIADTLFCVEAILDCDFMRLVASRKKMKLAKDKKQERQSTIGIANLVAAS